MEIYSFGYKYGLPPCNYYFDVSWIKNPARDKRWSLDASPDAGMRDFILSQANVQAFLHNIVNLLVFIDKLDGGQKVGFGCSSGRHRSFILAETVESQLKTKGLNVTLKHRDAQ